MKLSAMITALILTADNHDHLSDRVDDVRREGSAIVFAAPGIGRYGALRAFPVVKQSPRLTRDERHADALKHLLDLCPDAGKFSLIDSARLDFTRDEAQTALATGALLHSTATSHLTSSRTPTECTAETLRGSFGRKGHAPFTAECNRTPVDVVIVSHRQPHIPGWWQIRCQATTEFLTDHGIPAIAVEPQGGLAGLIADCRPRLVMNRSFSIPASLLRILAGQFPHVRFVTVCHSSHSDVFRSEAWIREQAHCIRDVHDVPNLYYGGVDERNHLATALESEKFVVLPNLVDTPADSTHDAGCHDPATVSLICAARTLKNIPTQLAAVALASRQRPLRLLLSLRGISDETLRNLLEPWQLDWHACRWANWPDYIENIAVNVDVGLQVSFTESFNYVALEHMLCGRPVVGSPAIRYLPGRWQASPDDPDDIAATLINVLDDYPADCLLANRVSHQFADECNAAFLTSITELLERTE